MAAKLTVLITCKNERQNIRACIDSVREIADEILVGDSGSTDGTLEIAQAAGCRIIEREYICCSSFKNWAIPQAAHPWVLLVDADERVTPELAAEIRAVLSSTDPLDAYRISFRPFIMGYELKYGGWSHDTAIRLFRRECRYAEVWVHADIVIPKSRVGRLRNKFLHYTYWTLKQYYEKQDRYTTLAVREMRKRGVKPSLLKMLFRPPWKFLRYYVICAGFLDGVPGLIMAVVAGHYTLAKYAKLWASVHGRSPESVAPTIAQQAARKAA